MLRGVHFQRIDALGMRVTLDGGESGGEDALLGWAEDEERVAREKIGDGGAVAVVRAGEEEMGTDWPGGRRRCG